MIDSALIGGVATGLVRAWRRGGRRTRIAIGVAFAGLLAAALVVIGVESGLIFRPLGTLTSAALAIPAILVLAFASISAREQIQSAAADELAQAEGRLRAAPDKPAVAWEVARLNLQSYIDRNLSQVSWIFSLILLVMFGGFCILCIGVWQAWTRPAQIAPSVIAASSGLIVQFIGATFLIVYRSTNEQAREYVSMLERINAVGMSAQLLEGIDQGDTGMRDAARVEIAKGLLLLYSVEPVPRSIRKSAMHL